MRPLEFNAVMGRTQDISIIKQSEDVKPLAEQQVITQSNIKTADARQEQVYQKKESDMDSQYDASKEGAGAQYFESGQKKKEKEEQEEGKVVIKSRATFDVKI